MLERGLAGGEAPAGCEHAVEGSGSSAALKVFEDDAAGLDPGLFLDRLGDASQPEVAEKIGRKVECRWFLVGKLCPLREPSRIEIATALNLAGE